MEQPKVNAVGVLEYPDDHEAAPREYSSVQRFFATVLLLFFFAVTVVTSALTLGAYCLTTDGTDGRVLEVWNAAREE